MGLFKKSKSSVNINEETNMARNNSATHVTPIEKSVSKRSPESKRVGFDYGIEEAVNLMRSLPDIESDITITVVKKTLESANVQVSAIIADAEKKEANIEQRNKTLFHEIEELQEKISLRNKEISTLTKDLKETSKVKKLLQKDKHKIAGDDARKAFETTISSDDDTPPSAFRSSEYEKENTRLQQNFQPTKIVET